MTNNAHEIVLTEDTRLDRGDKVRVGPEVDTKFSNRIGEYGVCIEGAIGIDILIKFDDGEIVEGPRSGLILTEYFTGAAPEREV